jgi:AcrR family transcriptional regulator
MSALAKELGVSRATLYRWTGDRDHLLADVIWTQLDAIISSAAARVRGVGQARLERIAGRFLDVLAGSPALRAHLVNDGEAGLRLMIAPNGLLRPRVVRRVRELIEQEVEHGYDPPASPALLADGIVSICERYLHNGGDPSLNPDPATAQSIIALLLREDDH